MPELDATRGGSASWCQRSERSRRALAPGSYWAIHDPDAVALERSQLRAAGFDGQALDFIDDLKELPPFATVVLPRLERVGLRAAATRH